MPVATRPGASSGKVTFQKACVLGASVDHRGLLEVRGDARDEPAEGPDRERHDGGDVDDPETHQGVHQAPVVDHPVDREHHRLAGHHLHDQHRDDEAAPTPEVEACDGDRGEEREEQGEEDDADGDQRRGQQRVREVRLPRGRLARPRGDVVLPRELERHQAGRAADDPAAGGERHVHHPVDREDRCTAPRRRPRCSGVCARPPCVPTGGGLRWSPSWSRGGSMASTPTVPSWVAGVTWVLTAPPPSEWNGCSPTRATSAG